MFFTLFYMDMMEYAHFSPGIKLTSSSSRVVRHSCTGCTPSHPRRHFLHCSLCRQSSLQLCSPQPIQSYVIALPQRPPAIQLSFQLSRFKSLGETVIHFESVVSSCSIRYAQKGKHDVIDTWIQSFTPFGETIWEQWETVLREVVVW